MLCTETLISIGITNDEKSEALKYVYTEAYLLLVIFIKLYFTMIHNSLYIRSKYKIGFCKNIDASSTICISYYMPLVLYHPSLLSYIMGNHIAFDKRSYNVYILSFYFMYLKSYLCPQNHLGEVCLEMG